MTRYPDDLPDAEKAQCLVDELVFGTSFVELTDDGPRRVDPAEMISTAEDDGEVAHTRRKYQDESRYDPAEGEVRIRRIS